MPQSQEAPPIVFPPELGDLSGVSVIAPASGFTEIKSTAGLGILVLPAATATALVDAGGWATV